MGLPLFCQASAKLLTLSLVIPAEGRAEPSAQVLRLVLFFALDDSVAVME